MIFQFFRSSRKAAFEFKNRVNYFKSILLTWYLSNSQSLFYSVQGRSPKNINTIGALSWEKYVMPSGALIRWKYAQHIYIYIFFFQIIEWSKVLQKVSNHIFFFLVFYSAFFFVIHIWRTKKLFFKAAAHKIFTIIFSRH